jgi:hypothetical protein
MEPEQAERVSGGRSFPGRKRFVDFLGIETDEDLVPYNQRRSGHHLQTLELPYRTGSGADVDLLKRDAFLRQILCRVMA